MKHMPAIIVVVLLAWSAPAPAVDAKQGKSATQDKTRIIVKDQSLTFDPKHVARGSAGFGWGLGSVKVIVLGRDDDACVFDFTDEIEGGYRVYRCRVPLDKPVRIFEQGAEIHTSFPLKDAKVISGGNLLLGTDEPPGPRIKMQYVAVPGTNYVNYQADVIVGSGMQATQGKRVTVRVRLFTDGTFQTEYIGMKDSGQVSFTLGKSDVGPGLETAVAGMNVRGRRFAIVRAEAAPALVKLLGGVQPQTQLGVEIELIKVE